MASSSMTRPTAKLPSLLATLSPSSTSSTSANTRAILIRPTTWPQDSFYLLTRHSLKFPLKSAPTAKAKPPAVADKGYGSASTSTASKADLVGSDEIKVAGKAWGVKFWNGRAVAPAPPRIPDPLIPHSLVEQWTSVDPSTLSQSTRDAVAQSQALIKSRYEERNSVLAHLREGKKARMAQATVLA